MLLPLTAQEYADEMDTILVGIDLIGYCIQGSEEPNYSI